MEQMTGLSNRDKVRVALTAAMAGGCRTCAEKLFALAGPAGATREEIEQAFVEGLRLRHEATALMWQKATVLLGHVPTLKHPASGGEPETIELSRFAAAVAANSAPDALRHVEAARSAGASDAAVRAALGVGRMVRSKAQAFSDAEVGELASETTTPERPVPGGGASTQTGCAPRTSEPGCGCA